MAGTVLRVVNDPAISGDDEVGNLFDGLKFFVSQRLPMRSHFIRLIRSNGGLIAVLEKLADYIIVDQARQDTFPGGISYRFIEDCIKQKQIVDATSFLVGPALDSIRKVGSARPPSSSRHPFTAEEDRILWSWVKTCRAEGKGTSGNAIYQSLATKVGTLIC